MTNESYRNIITNELMTNKHQNYIAIDIEEVLQCFQREVRSRSINSNEQEEKFAM